MFQIDHVGVKSMPASHLYLSLTQRWFLKNKISDFREIHANDDSLIQKRHRLRLFTQ